MLLDAPSFKAELTPEIALGIIQKSLMRKGWKSYKVQDIKLVYTPYWLFSFDVVGVSEGPAPTGQSALNAFSGELNDFVPALVHQPLKKTKSTEDAAEPEVETTAIPQSEVKETAATKVASHVGIQPDSVKISAVSKMYVASYRVWLEVAGDAHRIDVDAAVGSASGMELIPDRPKTWSEETDAALNKMKTPSGWAQLFGMLFNFASPKKEGSPIQKYAGLIVIILILMAVVFFNPLKSAGTTDCKIAPEYLGSAGLFGGTKPLEPVKLANNQRIVRGTCFITNANTEPRTVIIQERILDAEGKIIATNSTSAINIPQTQTPLEKSFEIKWVHSGSPSYSFQFEVL
ncbi:MAG: hypothetical protein V1834_01430 [Candidatus Micrarchaeota archaeon]